VPGTENAAKRWLVTVGVDQESVELPHFRHTVSSSDFLFLNSLTAHAPSTSFLYLFIKTFGKVTYNNYCVS